MIYVSYTTEKEHERSGWIEIEEWENEQSYVNLICEDSLGGARAICVDKSNILRRGIQKPSPIGQAYFGSYLSPDTKEVIGSYTWDLKEGLNMYRHVQGEKIKVGTKKDVW